MRKLIGLGLIGACGVLNAGAMGPVTEAPTWTGIYAGLNGGAIWAESNVSWTDISPLYSSVYGFSDITAISAAANATLKNKDFFTGGGQVGVNYQSGHAVVGVEGDFNYAGLNGDRVTSLTNPTDTSAAGIITEHFSTNWLSTVRARLGYASNNWLIYGTGGLAITQVNFRDSFRFPLLPLPPVTNVTSAASQNATKVGWTAGAGLEWNLGNNWSAKVEYLYADLGSVVSSSLARAEVSGTTLIGSNITQHHDLSANIGRVGINYRFA